MKRLIIFFVSLTFFITAFQYCDSVDPPPGEKPTLTLTLEDVSCIEAWIKLTTTNLQLPASITLLKNNQTRKTINLIKADTLIYVDSLLPNTSYQYQASSIENPATSNELSVITMDTTSHDFTFETFTFGGTAGSSTLYDVAIIDENNIWAVGEILVADTSQNGYTTYNAVHWDGSQWELKRIITNACGGVDYPPIKTISAFSFNDILFAHIDGSISHYNGIEFTNDCSLITQLNGSANKIWGVSKNDFYVVSGNGFIARYLNGTWSRIESGTDVNINDVFGVIDQQINQWKVFCAVSFVLQFGEHKILTIDENSNVDSLRWDTGRRVNSTWSNNGKIVYTSGGGIFNNKSGRWTEETTIPLYYTNRIRGNGLNDIFVAGDFGLLAHFNGALWKVYDEFLQLPTTSFNSVTVKGNIIAIVGYNGEKALVVIGK
jgi:hypothetical protein